MQAGSSATLQQCQTNAILALLNLNQPAESLPEASAGAKSANQLHIPTAGPPVWKILVLDQITKDVLATVLRVQDLRDVGVTLHVYVWLFSANKVLEITLAASQLHSTRPSLPDVPAVYFVSPTLANIRRIAEDLEKGLYERYHINFVEPLPRALLEELASAVAKEGTEELVDQVYIIALFSYLDLISVGRSQTNTFPSSPLLPLFSRCCPRQSHHHHYHQAPMLLRYLQAHSRPHHITPSTPPPQRNR